MTGGLVLFWLPMPISLPMIIIRVPLLTRHSTRVHDWLYRLSQRSPFFKRVLHPLLHTDNKHHDQ